MFLHFFSGVQPDLEIPVGDYPFLVTADDGSVVPVIHAHDFGKYLGRFDVTFDDDGNLIGYQGNPILLNKDVEQGMCQLCCLTLISTGHQECSIQDSGNSRPVEDSSPLKIN